MEDLKQQIYRLECSHLKPEVRSSKEKIGAVLDDGFFEIGSSGYMIYRADIEGDHALSTDPLTISDFQLHELGPEAVLTTYKIVNEQSGRETLRSSVWKKRASGWRLFFNQGTVAGH